ncbi:MAG TPA: HDOD domain-containing protein [Vicinamibacterales bacterium]|nr:HDOD domain-containing protein [Vicinamibacterales bacterium]
MIAEQQLPSSLVRGIEQLEPMPVTAERLVALMNGQEVSMATIAELVEFDQAIAATVLRMARSWAYAGSRPPETVRDAVVRLGTIPLLNIVLGDYLTRIRTSAPLYDLSEDDLWAHAAAAQLAVRAMTQECPALKLPAVTSTAALLHDIGKLVMSRCLNAGVQTITAHAREAGITFVEAERKLFGVNHAAVGAAMAVQWKFPDLVTDAIARHHDDELGESTPVLDAVVIANMVAKNIGAGLGAEGFNLTIDGACVRRFGLDFTRFARICLLTDTWLRELRQARK